MKIIKSLLLYMYLVCQVNLLVLADLRKTLVDNSLCYIGGLNCIDVLSGDLKEPIHLSIRVG